MLNDEKLRKFYSVCYQTHQKYHANVSDAASDPMDVVAVRNFNNSKCISTGTLTISVIHTSSHNGYCGTRILQLKRDYRVSTVNVRCNGHLFTNKTCLITTDGNIEMLQLQPYAWNRNSILFGITELVIDNVPFDVSTPHDPVYVCWRDGPYDCMYSLTHSLTHSLTYSLT